jgi:hypothetical protein
LVLSVVNTLPPSRLTEQDRAHASTRS